MPLTVMLTCMYSNDNSLGADVDLERKGKRFFSMIYDALTLGHYISDT